MNRRTFLSRLAALAGAPVAAKALGSAEAGPEPEPELPTERLGYMQADTETSSDSEWTAYSRVVFRAWEPIR